MWEVGLKTRWKWEVSGPNFNPAILATRASPKVLSLDPFPLETIQNKHSLGWTHVLRVNTENFMTLSCELSIHDKIS